MANDDDKPMFELRVVGKLNPSKLRESSEPDSLAEGRRRDRETGRKLAQTYAEESLLRLVTLMRSSTDENVVLRSASKIMDRAWGLVKAISEEEQKGADAVSLLDVLAAASSHVKAVERESAEAPAIEHTTIDNDQSAQAFFDELRRERGDDTVDGELVG